MKQTMEPLIFDFEWERADDVRGPELRATWASLRLMVGNTCLTRVFDTAARGVRSCMYIPLYPLAEWIVWNWWSLLYEPCAEGLSARRHYVRRHNLRHVGDGIATPDVEIRPLGQQVQIVWMAGTHSHQKVEFLNQGKALLNRTQFAQSLYDLVEGVCTRLAAENLPETPLAEAWQMVRASMDDSEESAFCQLVALQGKDPYSLEEAEAGDVLEAAAMVVPSLREAFFLMGSWGRLTRQATVLFQNLEWIEQHSGDLKQLVRLRHSTTLPDSRLLPWEQGYALARSVRAGLNAGNQKLGSLETFGQLLGLTDNQLADSVRMIDTLSGVDALVGENHHHSPAFVLKPLKRPENQMFSLCRGLADYFFSPHTPSLIVNAATEQQKRNRAFAAELLAPAETIQHCLAGGETSQEEIDEIAYILGVSSHVVLHQVENHDLAVIRSSS